MNSIQITLTETLKKTNQDFHATFTNKKQNVTGFILADGIGSHSFAEVGSQLSVTYLKEQLENWKPRKKEGLNYHQLFKNVRNKLLETFKAEYSKNENIDSEYCMGTTLLCLSEFEDRYEIAYVGNGSIWHLRGNFSEMFGTTRYLPWNAINLLNPHTIDEDGREKLYKFLSPYTSDSQIEPSIITLSKDKSAYGEIMILATDGLHSNDQIQIGKDPQGELWISGDRKMKLLFDSLKNYSHSNEINKESLENFMTTYINEIKEENLITDDLSFGIMYSKQAINYNTRENNKG